MLSNEATNTKKNVQNEQIKPIMHWTTQRHRYADSSPTRRLAVSHCHDGTPPPYFLKLSTPSVGVSTIRSHGTPSSRRRAKKLSHSATTCAHSARARPAYLLAASLSMGAHRRSSFVGVLSRSTMNGASSFAGSSSVDFSRWPELLVS